MRRPAHCALRSRMDEDHLWGRLCIAHCVCVVASGCVADEETHLKRAAYCVLRVHLAYGQRGAGCVLRIALCTLRMHRISWGK